MENKWWYFTRYFIVAVVLLTGLYDILAYAFGGWSATVSRRILGVSTVSPAIPLAIGFVMGHIFWPQPPASKEDTK